MRPPDAPAPAARPPAAPPAAPPAGHPPDWLRDSARTTAREVRLFFQTAAAFTFRPGRFAMAWAEGRQRAMNPLGFLTLALAGVGIVRAVGLWRTGLPAPGGLGAELLRAVGPFLHYLALGLTVHAILSRLGRRRRPAADSAALTLYAAGGPSAGVEVLAWLVALAVLPVFGVNAAVIVSAVGLGLALAAFCYALGYALGALHYSAWWHPPVALLLAFLLLGLFFGYVDPPGHFGLRWIVTLTDASGAFRPELRLGL